MEHQSCLGLAQAFEVLLHLHVEAWTDQKTMHTQLLGLLWLLIRLTAILNVVISLESMLLQGVAHMGNFGSAGWACERGALLSVELLTSLNLWDTVPCVRDQLLAGLAVHSRPQPYYWLCMSSHDMLVLVSHEVQAFVGAYGFNLRPGANTATFVAAFVWNSNSKSSTLNTQCLVIHKPINKCLQGGGRHRRVQWLYIGV